jgi:murein DD-endopeptidase MepM/ murein hydrolase activator NlpD
MQQQPPATLQKLSSFKGQVSSVTYESPSGQPGLDLFFENKQFPAVLNGTVKDISYESGYGNYVVVESIDPDTGESVDVLYGHLASRTPLKIGQQVSAGQLVGTQGGTGNVRSADGTIASIDFLAPAPRGSGSMKPYRNYDKLRRRIARELGR